MSYRNCAQHTADEWVGHHVEQWLEVGKLREAHLVEYFQPLGGSDLSLSVFEGRAAAKTRLIQSNFLAVPIAVLNGTQKGLVNSLGT